MRVVFFCGLALAVLSAAPAFCAPDSCGPSGCECKGPDCPREPSYQPAPQPRPAPVLAAPAGPLTEADRLFSQGRYQEAESKYYEAQKALLWTPEKCKADLGLAKTYLKLGNQQSALFWFRSANEAGCPEAGPETRKLERLLPPPKAPERPLLPSIPTEPAWDYSQMMKALSRAEESGKSTVTGLFDAAFGLAKPHLTAGGPPKEFVFTLPALERYSKGSQGSAIVDFRDIPWEEDPAVDPAVVGGQLSAAELKARDAALERIFDADAAMAAKDWAGMVRQLRLALKARPDDKDIRRHVSIRMAYRNLKTGSDQGSPRTVALLDALELGQGDWRTSLGYLREEAMDEPRDGDKRDAFNFLQGWAMGTADLRDSIKDLPPAPPPPSVPAAEDLVNRAFRITDPKAQLELFREAARLSPGDRAIRDMVHYLEGSLLADAWKEAAGGVQ